MCDRAPYHTWALKLSATSCKSHSPVKKFGPLWHYSMHFKNVEKCHNLGEIRNLRIKEVLMHFDVLSTSFLKLRNL